MTQIFFGSTILAVVGTVIGLYGIFVSLSGDKSQGSHLMLVALLPCVFALGGFIFYITKSKEINYKKDKT